LHGRAQGRHLDIRRPGRDKNVRRRRCGLRTENFMRNAIFATLAAGVGFLGVAAMAADRTIEGQIKKFECGDNCYLTIVDAARREQTGLCVAHACNPWNEKTEIPRKLIGQKVRATTGTGVQRDGAGNVMGKMMSFTKIEFVK
jgi:hypothetical protein